MNPEQDSQKLMIDLSGMAGLAPKFFGDANTAQGYGTTGNPERRAAGGKGQLASGIWNPLRIFGYLAPATSLSSALAVTYADATYKQDGEHVATLYDTLGSSSGSPGGIWAASKDTLFYRYTNGNAFELATHATIRAGFVSGASITDLEIYPVNGVNQMMVAYKGSSHSDIAITTPNQGGTSSTNTTWFSGTASGGGTFLGASNDIVLVPSGDGFLYVLDGSYVHRIDGTVQTGGTNGTVTQSVLVDQGANTGGAPGNQYVDAIDYQGQLWIVKQSVQNPPDSSGDTFSARYIAVVAWNRQIASSASTTTIPISGMQSVKKIYLTADGDLRIIGISSNRTVQIRRYNGTTFEVMQELPIWARPTYRDSCTVMEGLFVWQGYDGKIYAHGKLVPILGGTLQTSDLYAGDNIYILGDAYPLANTDSTFGAILPYGVGNNGSSSSGPTSVPGIMLSMAYGSTYKTYQWLLHGTGTQSSTAQYASAGNVYSLVQRLPGLSNVNYLRIWHLPNGSGGSSTMGNLTIYKNQSATAMTGTPIAITQTDVQRGYKYIPLGNQGNGTFALQFEVSWPTNVALGDTTDWMPYAVEVDYSPDTKLK